MSGWLLLICCVCWPHPTLPPPLLVFFVIDFTLPGLVVDDALLVVSKGGAKEEPCNLWGHVVTYDLSVHMFRWSWLALVRRQEGTRVLERGAIRPSTLHKQHKHIFKTRQLLLINIVAQYTHLAIATSFWLVLAAAFNACFKQVDNPLTD